MNRSWPALLATLLLIAGPALAACPPPEAALIAVRSAARIQIEQLAGEATRVDTPLAHVPGRTLGYEVEGVFRVSSAIAEALQRAFGRNDSYACGPGAARSAFDTAGPLPIGMWFASHGNAVAVVLHLPEGVVEIQNERGVRTSAPLSLAGQRRWEEALRLFAREARTSPDEFYQQMLPPLRVPAEPATPGPAPDSSRSPEPRTGLVPRAA